VTLDLTKSGKPVSCLILGDNGTGKSSFVDAIEFALRGKMTSSSTSWRKNIRRVGNLEKGQGASCYCEIELSDGSWYTRSLARIEDQDDKWEVTPQDPVSGFDAANFVLRRDDIVSFSRLAANQRTQLFASFLRGVTDKIASTRPREVADITVLKGELESIASEQRDIVTEIATLLNADATRLDLFHPGALDSLYNSRGIIRRYATMRKKGRRRAKGSELDRLLTLRRAYKNNHRRWAHIKQEATGWHREQRHRDVHEIVQRLEGSVSDSFRRISSAANFISAIRISADPLKNSLTFSAELPDSRLVPIEDYFSEANLDLLAFLIFLGMLKEASLHGQPKLLILDDVLQSVDAAIRLEVGRYLLTDFADWQIIMTFHERLWREQFRTLCAQNNHQLVNRDIASWSYLDGPILVQPNVDASVDCRQAMTSSSPILIASQAGILLETMSDWLSKSLAASITRRPDDKYTLGDTWPGVSKILRRYSVKPECEKIGDYLQLRNLVGAHYNEWAQNVSLAEVRAFATAVTELWSKVWCDTCRTVVARDAKEALACQCAGVAFEKN